MSEATPHDTIRKHEECTLSASEVISRGEKATLSADADTGAELGERANRPNGTDCSEGLRTRAQALHEGANYRQTKSRVRDAVEHTGLVGERLGDYALLLQHMLEINHLLDVVPQESWSAAEAGALAAALRGIAAGRASAKSRFNFGERRFRIVR